MKHIIVITISLIVIISVVSLCLTLTSTSQLKKKMAELDHETGMATLAADVAKAKIDKFDKRLSQVEKKKFNAQLKNALATPAPTPPESKPKPKGSTKTGKKK